MCIHPFTNVLVITHSFSAPIIVPIVLYFVVCNLFDTCIYTMNGHFTSKLDFLYIPIADEYILVSHDMKFALRHSSIKHSFKKYQSVSVSAVSNN